MQGPCGRDRGLGASRRGGGERRRGSAAASLHGDVDLANAQLHGDALCELLDAHETPVFVIDCTELELLESQGMAMMHRVHRYGTAHGIEVVWHGLAPRHRRVLEITGLDRFVVIRGDGSDPTS